MQKKEFLILLRDPEICREIFEVVRRGGKPSAMAGPPLLRDAEVCREIIEAFKRGRPAPPPAPVVQKPPVLSVDAAAADKDKYLALREKMMRAVAGKQGSVPQQSVAAIDAALSKIITTETQTAEQAEAERKQSMSEKLKHLRDQERKIAEEKLAAAKAAEEAKAAELKAKEAAKEAAAKGRPVPAAAANEEPAPPQKNTFVIDRTCPICERKTHVVKVKADVVPESQDLDLCKKFKDFNPYLYTILACEHCGYAAEEGKFQSKAVWRHRKRIEEFLEENNMAIPFTEDRTPDDALSFFEIAIIFSKIFDPSPGRQAFLYQQMAWICRYEGRKEDERKYMEQAAELYSISLEEERYPIGGISDDLALYITGALYYMLGDVDKATKYLSRVMGNQGLRKSFPKLFEKAQGIWQEIRASRR